MNNIVAFARPFDVAAIPPVAWAVAQLIVINGLDPETVANAVCAYNAACAADDDDTETASA
jgi:hypothetical protein